MLGRGSAHAQRAQMRLGGVALVHAEREARIAGVERPHERVAVGLGEDRGGADRRDPRIAGHDRLQRARQRQIGDARAAIAVDAHVRRTHRQRQQRAAHRQQRRLQDVQAVDLVAIRPADRPGERARADDGSQACALRDRKHLGVGKAANAPLRVQDHRSRHHRARQRPAAGLIDPATRARLTPSARRISSAHSRRIGTAIGRARSARRRRRRAVDGV